jgi:quercetin dioxygenase-like cupin family protein
MSELWEGLGFEIHQLADFNSSARRQGVVHCLEKSLRRGERPGQRAACGAQCRAMSLDPVETNPDHYTVVFENDRVRVLEYTDRPGERTTPHEHPDSVMHTLSSFRRRLYAGDAHRDVEMPAGLTGWLPAQQHAGENIGDTPTHVLFVELKEGTAAGDTTVGLGPE